MGGVNRVGRGSGTCVKRRGIFSTTSKREALKNEHSRASGPKGLLINSGFSQIVVTTGKRMACTTGPVSIDEHGEPVGGGDLAAQTAQAMRNIGMALVA